MSNAMAPVSKDSPLWKAWEAYRATEQFENAHRWAKYPEHIEGSMWAAFVEGFDRAASLSVSPVPPDCTNCGYPRSEHHVGEGWCLQSPAAYPTKYAPALAEPDEPREIDLMKALVESLKNHPAAVSPVPEPSEPIRVGPESPCIWCGWPDGFHHEKCNRPEARSISGDTPK